MTKTPNSAYMDSSRELLHRPPRGHGARYAVYVISKDTGFDPLLKHLEERGISCQRLSSIADVVSAERTPALNADRVSAVLENLAKRKSAKPLTLKTLRTTIQALFPNELIEGELDRLIEQLTMRGAIRITDGKVHYESVA